MKSGEAISSHSANIPSLTSYITVYTSDMVADLVRRGMFSCKQCVASVYQ